MTFGSHTLCYDEHGQELDYHNDVPIADSQASMTWSEYFRQDGGEDGIRIAEQLDAEHALLHGPTMPSTVSEEAVLLEEEMPAADVPAIDSQEWKGWGKFLRQQGDSCGLPITDRLDAEHELLQGPTKPVTVGEEAVLLEETPAAELVKETSTVELEEAPTVVSEELTPIAELSEMPATKGGIPTVDMRQFLAGLETLTPEMLSEISMHIECLRQLVAPLASTKSLPPGLPATPMVPNPMEQALLKPRAT